MIDTIGEYQLPIDADENDIPAPAATPEIPEHVVLDLIEEPGEIEEYVADAVKRIDDAVTGRIPGVDNIGDVEERAAHGVVAEVSAKASEALQDKLAVDPASIDAERRRRQIIATQRQRHAGRRALISFGAIYSPPSRLR